MNATMTVCPCWAAQVVMKSTSARDDSVRHVTIVFYRK